MDTLLLEGTEDTPKIILDKGTGVFEISGRSLPEDTATFYEPVLNWLNEYKEAPNESTTFIMKLEYFNTASSKLLLDLLMVLEEVDNTTVDWYYDEDDEDMQEAGEEFSEIVEVAFDIKTY